MDETALNGLKIQCMGLDGNIDESHWYTVEYGFYGEWKEWSQREPNYFVCGAQVRY